MAENQPGTIRRTILFTGTVQGVGFRYTTEAVARRFAVTGFVRNLPDGRVEVVAEGASGELDGFQLAVEEALSRRIRETTVTDATATGEYASFGIAF